MQFHAPLSCLRGSLEYPAPSEVLVEGGRAGFPSCFASHSDCAGSCWRHLEAPESSWPDSAETMEDVLLRQSLKLSLLSSVLLLNVIVSSHIETHTDLVVKYPGSGALNII